MSQNLAPPAEPKFGSPNHKNTMKEGGSLHRGSQFWLGGELILAGGSQILAHFEIKHPDAVKAKLVHI